MATPAWIGASTGQPQLAAHVNQFLGAHAASLVYTGASISSQTTAGSGGVNSNGLWVAQSFTTGTATALGRARLTLGYTGSPNPLTLSLYANSGGAPTGSALTSTVVPANCLTAAGAAVSVPLPAGLTPSSTYWLVVPAVGDGSDFYTWSKSNQTSGASTSANGATWTAQTYGLLFSCFDQSPIPPLTHTWEDSGARWTTLTGNTDNQPTSLQEYTVAQGAGQYVYSSRAMTYAGGSLASIA